LGKRLCRPDFLLVILGFIFPKYYILSTFNQLLEEIAMTNFHLIWNHVRQITRKSLLALSFGFFILLVGSGIGCGPSADEVAAQAEIDRFMAQYAAEFGSNQKAVDKEGDTLLHKAVDKWNLAVIKFLVSKGADVNAANLKKVTPLYLATLRNDNEIIKFLVSSGANINVRESEYNSTPLHQASYQNNFDIIKLLISKGADINAKDNDGESPFFLAASNNNVECFNFFLSKGADINEKDAYGTTLLQKASGSLDISKLLVSKGANINAKNINGYSPLLSATIGYIYSGKNDVVDFLVSNGADINIQNNDGDTPLHIAASTNYVNQEDKTKIDRLPVVKFLVSKGAALNIRNKYGKTPLDIVDTVNQRSADGAIAMPDPAYEAKNPIREYLLSVGATGGSVAGSADSPQRASGGHAAAAETGGHGSGQAESGSWVDWTGPVNLEVKPFIVNLNDLGGRRMLKLTMSIEAETPELAEELNAKMSQVRDTILLLLSSVQSDDISGLDGKQRLKNQMLNRINPILTRGKVRNIYLSEMVVQ
jgi:ankyrin repeat protein/flagellar basal body-associated protein FliL